jgi:hypothetical protein
MELWMLYYLPLNIIMPGLNSLNFPGIDDAFDSGYAHCLPVSTPRFIYTQLENRVYINLNITICKIGNLSKTART